jgi:uncharacterized protein (TIGR00255 family)
MGDRVIRSMTGYGEAVRALDEGVVRVEVKSVNHRFLNTTVRTPPGFERVETELAGWLRPFLSRGHVHLSVSLEGATGRDGSMPQLDIERARQYANLLHRLKDELGLQGGPDVAAVARFGDIFRAPDGGSARGAADAVSSELLRDAVQEAVKKLVSMREVEGARLHADMAERLRLLRQEMERIQARAPERLIRERDRLREAVRELATQPDVDEERIAREIAYLAERWDVSEELVRLSSHLDLFRDTLALDGGEAVGKRHSFVLQEMHREVNTIGSKAAEHPISHRVVEMKTVLERMREQSANVE